MNRRWAVLALVFFGILISYIDRGNLGIAAVEIMRDFNLDGAAMGVLLSSFFWTYGLLQFPAGAFVDRFGIRIVYAVAFVIWSAASASIALTTGFGGILALRLVLGAAEAVGPLASLAYIRRNFAPAEQGLPTAIYIAGQTLGPAAGAWIGSHLVGNLGWRPMFAITGLAGLVWVVPWLALAPRGTGPRTKQAAPAVDVRTAAQQPALWALSACAFLLAYFWYFVLNWAPAYLRIAHGFSVMEMGRIMSIPLAAMAVASLATGAAGDRLARGWPASKARLVLCAAGLAAASGFAFLNWAPDRSWALPVLFVAMCAFGVANSSFWALAQAAAPSALIGRVVGYLNTLAQAAGALAPVVTGWLLGPEKRFGVALLIAAACPAVACLALVATGYRNMDRLRDRLGVNP